jgi:predicted permease
VAGLFIRSVIGVAHADLGFQPDHVLNITVDPSGAGYSEAQGAPFYRELLERARALPGVQSASLTWLVPLGDDYFDSPITVPGYESPHGQAAPSAGFDHVSPEYFKTMGIALLQGRDFNSGDDQNSPPVAVINQAMAQRFWHGQNPLGREFAWAANSKHPLRVVGVVRNSRVVDLYSPYDPFFYTPLAQNYVSFATLQIRAAGTANVQPRAIESLIQTITPTVPFYDAQTMSASLDGVNGLFLFNVGAVLTGALGLIGLILAIVGVYGVMSYAASRRTHEIGIRTALGAQPRQILWLIGKQALLTLGAGLGIGLLGAFGIGQLIRDLVIGTSPTDTLTYVTVAGLLAAVALAACYIPARRAMRVDPMVALRHE